LKTPYLKALREGGDGDFLHFCNECSVNMFCVPGTGLRAEVMMRSEPILNLLLEHTHTHTHTHKHTHTYKTPQLCNSAVLCSTFWQCIINLFPRCHKNSKEGNTKVFTEETMS
jgi:hypothetical protein